ncbi:hypothetical protein K488DRAFT_85092 [Vararia minispora EC-137]|uniref:Uncharacterized protein n=1 Tax=Vararia minispora EC-137 TaxID=1314806 RepID=A0ACB8QNA2_9AGAM|nr:hypothetical protein K488DRAFT_85092 [Vararia minispora EC-137]
MDASASIPNITDITGPLLFGALVNWALFGVLVSQIYYYHVHFHHDPRTLKVFIYFIFLVETAQTGIVAHDSFVFLAGGWGNLSLVSSQGMLWLTAPFMDGLVGGCVQLFYAWRIFVLHESRVLFGVLGFLSLVSMGGGFAAGLESIIFAHEDSTRVQEKTKVIVTPIHQVWGVCMMVCDVLIFACMIAWYRKVRHSATYKLTHDIITNTVKYTVASGALTTTATVAALIIFSVIKHGFYFSLLGVIITKCKRCFFR